MSEPEAGRHPTAPRVKSRTGERVEGFLTSDLPVLQGWASPYVTITSRHDGPRATIIAGIHGWRPVCTTVLFAPKSMLRHN